MAVINLAEKFSKFTGHCPVAEDECHLIEPRGAPNTGDETTAVTKHTI